MATYYLDPVMGNDSNNGTSKSTPWKTFVKANATVNGGDTVICVPGVYTESTSLGGGLSATVSLTRGGSVGNYVTYKSETKYGAILYGQHTEGSNNGTTYSICLGANNVGYVKFVDFEMRWYNKANLWISSTFTGISYIWLEGCKLHDNSRYNIVEDGNGGGVVGIFSDNCNNIYLVNNIIYNQGRLPTSGRFLNQDHVLYANAYTGSKPHHLYVVGNIIWNTSGNPIELYSNNDVIANNVIAWNAQNNIGANGFMQVNANAGATQIINNIFYQAPPANNWCLLDYGGCGSTIIKNNFVWNSPETSEARFWYPWNGNTLPTNPSNYSNNHSSDIGQLPAVNPLFVSADWYNKANPNFQLQQGSPCIDAGIATGLSWYTKDILDATWSGTMEAGAYQWGGVSTYYSAQKSGWFTKNDCGAGYHGSSVQYIVPAATYSNQTSQASVDALAQADVDANGQTYANTTGTCIADVVPGVGEKLPLREYVIINGALVTRTVGGVLKL